MGLRYTLTKFFILISMKIACIACKDVVKLHGS